MMKEGIIYHILMTLLLSDKAHEETLLCNFDSYIDNNQNLFTKDDLFSWLLLRQQGAEHK